VTRAVLDTNTIVSGTIVPQGISGQILDAARQGRFSLFVSAPIIAEAVRNLSHSRIASKYRISASDIDRVASYLRQQTGYIPITATVHGVASHAEDDLILATAVSAEADYLVTGDHKLQELQAYEGVLIVSPRQFLDVLRVERTEGSAEFL
jgi:uncharacterized protein